MRCGICLTSKVRMGCHCVSWPRLLHFPPLALRKYSEYVEQTVGPESRCIGISQLVTRSLQLPVLTCHSPRRKSSSLVDQRHAMDKGNLAVIACGGKTEQR